MWADRIAKYLGISPNTVRKYLKSMLKEKIVVDFNPESIDTWNKIRLRGIKHLPAINTGSGKPKFYVRGPNSSEYDKMLREGIPKKVSSPPFRFHHTACKMRVIRHENNAVELNDKWNYWTQNDYIRHKEATFNYKNYGKIKLRWTYTYDKKSRNVYETITVWLPHDKYFKPKEGIEYREKIIKDIHNWLGRNGYPCTEPEQCKKNHIGRGSGRKGKKYKRTEIATDIWADSSPGWEEIESSDPDKIELIDKLLRGAEYYVNKSENINAQPTVGKNDILNLINNKFEGLLFAVNSEREEHIKIFKGIRDDLKDNFGSVIDRLDKVIEKEEKLQKSTTYEKSKPSDSIEFTGG
jgi:predicted transcriptional regulator